VPGLDDHQLTVLWGQEEVVAGRLPAAAPVPDLSLLCPLSSPPQKTSHGCLIRLE
ncbi:hypothetical protein E3U43_009703, partial [Larimichthys crocea]